MWTKMRMTYLDRIFKDAKDFILFSCCNGIGICLLKKKKNERGNPCLFEIDTVQVV